MFTTNKSMITTNFFLLCYLFLTIQTSVISTKNQKLHAGEKERTLIWFLKLKAWKESLFEG